MTIVKNTKTGSHRVHAIGAGGKPVCGGGFQARTAEWQTDLAEPNYKRCAAILQRRATPPRKLISAHPKV